MSNSSMNNQSKASLWGSAKMSSNGGSSSTISLLDSDKISGSKQQQTSSASSDLTDDAYQDPLPWILFQILESELLDGLPLRIMFSFNSGT